MLMIEVKQTALKTLLSELVQMPTFTNETATCQAALDWVKYQLRNVPLKVHEAVYNDHPSIIFTSRSGKQPKLLLHAHLDVASAPVTALKLTERDGRYYGRGVFDMKYAAAAYIEFLQGLGDEVARYDLGVMLTTDEELTAGEDGCARWVQNGWGGGVVINPDAIGNWNIERAAKGLMRVQIEAKGESGHGSRPWQYQSAINTLMNYLSRLSNAFPQEPCGDSQHAHDTMNIGIIRGGNMANQVAGRAVAELDMRFMPQTGVQGIRQRFHDVDTSSEVIKITEVSVGRALAIDPDRPEVQLLMRLIQEVAGINPAFVLSHGASENIRYHGAGFPVLTFGPPGGGHHGDDEWVSVEGVSQFASIIRRYAEEVALA